MISILRNSSNQNLYNIKFDYSQPIKFSDEGKLSFGSLYEELSFEAATKEVTNLDYKRRTAASYVELQSKFDKVNVIVGAEPKTITLLVKQIKLN
jgi:hypothetical protein